MRLVTEEGELRDLARDAGDAGRLAVDLEASGMFAYRASICTVQLAWRSAEQVAVVDTLTAPVSGLGRLLGVDGPIKIVHDVAFDARLLAEAGVELGNVHDTALAGHMLGRPATGLASLLASELGVQIAKGMQHHDWRVRPLDDAMLAYLAADVVHLEALEAVLWREVTERGIEDEVLEETRYRLATAVAGARAPQDGPAYARIKGASKLPERERAALRVLAELREHEAKRRDVPPYRVVTNETLLVLAHARPRTPPDVARTRGMASGSPDARAFVEEVARGLATAGDAIPAEERVLFERPQMPASVAKARREREVRLLSWRRAEAKRRGVDEQVVLPGHCAKDAVDGDIAGVDDLARVRGIGAFRVSRDGDAIVRALRGDAVTA
ncbi:MAG TPA: HRDC domain-containing protein [Polyangiaceae bacterium]|jgi:ribonuclease D